MPELTKREREDVISPAGPQPEIRLDFAFGMVSEIRRRRRLCMVFLDAPLSGHLQPFLDVSRENPAEVRNPIEVTQYFAVKILLSGTERNDIPFCTAARKREKLVAE